MDGFKTLPKMQHFKEGGAAYCGGGRMKKGGEVADKDMAQDKKLIKKAFKQHDEAEHDKAPTEIKLKKGGRSAKDCGTVRKFKVGGSVSNVYGTKKDAGDIDNIKKTKNIEAGKAAAKSGAKEMPNKYKTGRAVKKFAEGGVTEGQNAGIDDDTRARAMKFVQEQADKRESESTKSESRPAKSSFKKASVDDEAGSSRGRPAEGSPKSTYGSNPPRSRTKEEVRDAVPTGGKAGMGPTESKGNSASGSELGRNVSAAMNAMGPGRIVTAGALALREMQAGKKAQDAYNTRAALRRSEEGLSAAEAARAARSAREAKTLNPNAWLAGPKGMKENFKSGRSVKRMNTGGTAS